MVIIGLTLGPLVDRLSRRKLMIVSDLVRAATFAALPFVDQPGAIVALAAVGGIATGFFRPAVWAGMPNLVEEKDLDTATSLLADHGERRLDDRAGGRRRTARALRPIARVLGQRGELPVLRALIARIPARGLQSSDPLTRGHWQDVRDGLGLVLRSRPLTTVLVVWRLIAIDPEALEAAGDAASANASEYLRAAIPVSLTFLFAALANGFPRRRRAFLGAGVVTMAIGIAAALAVEAGLL